MLDISTIRLQTQQLARPKFSTASEVVSHFGAMQAQDYMMAKWAIGVRMANATDALVEKALDAGKIIRTHLMRPTWHFVAAEDLHWMLELTAPNILRLMKSQDKKLGLDEKTYAKSNGLLVKALEKEQHMTRAELIGVLQNSDIASTEYRGGYLLANAEMQGIICSGKRKAGKQTYTLIDGWVKKEKHFTRNEALAELAKRYFTSHGPATLKDFIWWSGLSVADAKAAVEMNKKHFVSEEFDSQMYYIPDSFKGKTGENMVLLLPAFDEFLIAYKDRSASIIADFTKHAFTNNGIFKPIIVVNGQVIGTWKRTVKKDKISIETNLLQKTLQTFHKDLEKEARRYGDFMGKTVELI